MFRERFFLFNNCAVVGGKEVELGEFHLCTYIKKL